MTTGIVNLNGYEFEGPYASTVSLQNRPGVYVITGRNRSNDEDQVIDVGVSEDVRSGVVNHDRKRSWRDQRYWYLGCAVHYTDTITGRYIEKNLRDYFNPPCGVKQLHTDPDMD